MQILTSINFTDVVNPVLAFNFMDIINFIASILPPIATV